MVLLLETVVDVRYGLEPRHPRVMDMVSLVVKYHQLVNLPYNIPQVHLCIGCLARGLLAQEIVHQIVILKTWLHIIAGVNPVDIGQKDIAGLTGDIDLILDMQRQLKIILPVTAFIAVIRQNRILKKDAQSVKVGAESIQYYDVGGDHQKITRKLRIRLIELVEIAPGQHEAHQLCLAGASGHLYHKAPPLLVKHTGGHSFR